MGRREVTRRQKAVAGFAVLAATFVVLGLPDFAHGVAWPDLRGDLDRPLADLGAFLSVQTAGYLVAAGFTGRAVRRWGTDRLVLGCALTSAAGLAVVAGAPSWPVVLAGATVLGFGSGGMDAGLNAAVALRGDGRLMGALHAGYGVGASAGPLVVGVALVTGAGWRAAYAAFAVVTVVVVLSLVGRSLGGGPVAPGHEGAGTGGGMLLPCAAFFAYVALEVTIGQWAFTALTEDRGLGDLAASAWVAAYWGGLTLGRVWLGARGHQRSAARLLAGSATGALAAAVVLSVGGTLTPVGLPLAGLALSTVFPTLMLVTPVRVGAARAAAAVGWQIVAAGLGGAAGPALAGVVLGTAGVDAYGPVVVVMAITFVLLVLALRR